MDREAGKITKEKRLSEDSTASETSVSGSNESESDRNTDESTSNDTTQKEETPGEVLTEEEGLKELAEAAAWSEEEEKRKLRMKREQETMEWLLSFPEIRGRYTDADPAFAADKGIRPPPIVLDYRPRQYNNNRRNFQQRDNYQHQRWNRNDGNFRNDRAGQGQSQGQGRSDLDNSHSNANWEPGQSHAQKRRMDEVVSGEGPSQKAPKEPGLSDSD